MAKFPYNVSGTRSTIANGNIRVDVTVKDGNNVVKLVTAYEVAPTTPAFEVLGIIMTNARERIAADFAVTDIPALFDFPLDPLDVVSS